MILYWFCLLSTNVCWSSARFLTLIWKSKAFGAIAPSPVAFHLQLEQFKVTKYLNVKHLIKGTQLNSIRLERVMTSFQVVRTCSPHSLIIVSTAPLAHRWPDSNRHTQPGRTLGQAGSLSNHWPSSSAHPLRLRWVLNFQILLSHQS